MEKDIQQDQLRNLQLLEFEILKEFVSICEKNELTYYLAEGTLLGAIRHHGFIPWDDDVDVMMPREDYEKFLKIASNGLEEPYKIRHYKTDGQYRNGFLKLVNPQHHVIRIIMERRFEEPIWVDVFPLDGIPAKRFTQKWQLLAVRIRYHLMRFARIQYHGTDVKSKSKAKQILFTLDRKLHFSKLLSFQKQCERLEKTLKHYSYEKNEMTINYYSEYRLKQLFPKSYYGQGTDCEFEGLKLKVPTEWDKILTRLYGDYMQLPPEEQRVCKHTIHIV